MSLKAFRLFVSSTFADFNLEREVLQHQVFPALDAYCAAKGYQFYPLDLRWGVSEEAQLDQRTAEICLGEVRAALDYPPPNFLIMLGNRYGWVPLPYAIAADEFETVVSFLQDRGQLDALQGLRAVYERDDNHLVPAGLVRAELADNTLISAYTLRSREDVPDLRSADAWKTMERGLREALQEAAKGLLALGRIGTAAHEKYFTSLTEREIRLALVGDQKVAVDAGGPAAIAFVREIANGTTANPRYNEDEPRLLALKEAVKEELSEEHILCKKVMLGASGELDGFHLEAFASDIESKLKAAIDRHVTRVEALERSQNFALETERAAHRAFATQKLKVFVGQDSNLAVIERYLKDESEQPLVLYGRSGLGKSSLMARAVKAAEEKAMAPVIARFVGASAASSNLRSLLLSLADDLLALGFVTKPEEFDQDINKFNGQIEALLATIDKPVTIFLDALDQLQAPRTFGWLPCKLPPNLKLVVSVLNDAAYEADSDVYRSLKQRLAPDVFLEIEPLLPSQGREILLALERQSRCRLQGGQRDYVISQFELAGASPLYLKTAFEIAQSWKSTAHAGEGQYLLAPDTSRIIAQFIDELSSVHHHKPELVARTLGFIVAAKDGLSESELSQALSGEESVMRAISSERHGAVTDRLPPSVWVRLHRDLAPFLVEKLIDDQRLFQFFHRQVAQVARERHYEAVKTELHKRLAAYFESQATRQGDRAIYSKRCLSELPYQLRFANEKAQLDQILESPDWIEQKFNAFGTQTVANDYEQFGHGELQQLIGRTLRLVWGICARDKRQLLAQLHGRLMAYQDAAPFCATARQLVQKPALLTSLASLTLADAELMRLEGHSGYVNALTVLPGGRLASGSNEIILWDTNTGEELARLHGHRHKVLALAVLPDDFLASGDDNTIRLWNIRSAAEVARLEGHSGPVWALVVLPGGRLLSGSYDSTIRIWDFNSGAEVLRLKGQGPVTALAVLPERRLASSDDDTIRLWDLNTGAELAILKGHFHKVTTLAALPDGRLASGSTDKTIRLWDAKSGSEIARFDGDTEVESLIPLPDGRLASGSGGGTVRLWDTNTGKELVSFEGHGGGVKALAVLSDGLLCSGSYDETIRVWETKKPAGPARPDRHGTRVTALAVLPDGRLVSGSDNTTIRLWDSITGAKLAEFKGHGYGVTALAALPNSRLASSDERSLRFWDADTGKELARLKAHGGGVEALAVLPDGRLASGSANDTTIRLWDVNTCTELARFECGNWGMVVALAALPDGRLVSRSIDSTIRLWDTNTGTELARLKCDVRAVDALVAMLDCRVASISCNNPAVHLWDVTSGQEVGRLEGHTAGITALALLPDGRLASGSSDNTIRLWDVVKGTEITRLEIDAAISCLLALSDNRLVAGDALGRLHWLKVL